MAPVATTRTGRRSSSVFRGVLSGALLVAALILGLLGMHTLNLHGTAAADAPATAAVTATASSSARQAVAHDSTTHTAMAQAHPSGNTTGTTEMTCASCGTDDHASMAMMCLLALLLALVLLVAPGILRSWPGALFRSALTEVFTARALPPPSLHVLCISRT